MEAVKIVLYQNMVNYRKEMSYGYVQTYPLPTPSIVKGMVHAIMGLNEFHSLKISIQGESESVVTNMQKVYKFDRDRKSRPTNPYDVIIGQSHKTVTHGVMFVDQIVDMNLMLHVSFDEPDLNEKLLQVVKQKTVVLGRNEDIACVDFEKTKMVTLRQDTEDYMLGRNIFIPQNTAKKAFLSGTVYRLPFYYYPVKSHQEKRIFKFSDVMYVAKDHDIREIDYLIDDDNDIVFFLSMDTYE